MKNFWFNVLIYALLIFGFTFIYMVDPVLRSQSTFVYQDF